MQPTCTLPWASCRQCSANSRLVPPPGITLEQATLQSSATVQVGGETGQEGGVSWNLPHQPTPRPIAGWSPKPLTSVLRLGITCHVSPGLPNQGSSTLLRPGQPWLLQLGHLSLEPAADVDVPEGAAGASRVKGVPTRWWHPRGPHCPQIYTGLQGFSGSSHPAFPTGPGAKNAVLLGSALGVLRDAEGLGYPTTRATALL